ncbi:asparagine synthase (glutamine-hydrolyzing) [Sphingobacteriales bacterium UPWRP_1]|nr:asparagine synthase (glutamine-hydrolyzing) [Sphingobacteriales bacterium TSM_CSS]PSJ74667.1 asparagine synthase (glutamine-hydrolyzing) [Sphingobacteriales bacterium UPWRP_1]
MCGIAGFFTHRAFFSETDLHKATRSLEHRGPDAEGFYSDGIAFLGHRRLRVIDLSMAANQPMVSQNGRYVMVYNGEVFNFRELTSLLNKASIYCKTNSDTEVILELFALHGTGFVHLLNGMFAIAIYDKTQHHLYLFRDRMGVKPLYYFWNGHDFAFASELKALAILPQIDKTICRQALQHYLQMGCIPAPLSIYQNCYKLEQGTYAVVSGGGILQLNTYWNLQQQLSDTVVDNQQQAKQTFADLLTSSVRYRMIADVPFGTFLSGGTDSSLVTAIAQSVASKPVNTFTIGFSDAKFNEAPFAKKIAQQLGTNHHELMLTEKDALQLIPELSGIYDEPYADSSAIPTLLVSKMAKQHVTVILSGEGGDELFWGYGAHRWANRLNNPLLRMVKTPLAALFGKMNSRYRRVAALLNFNPRQLLPLHIHSQEQYYFSQSETIALLQLPPEILLTGYEKSVPGQPPRKLTPAEQQALFDLTFYLPDDLLVKTDRASMYYGLEARTPYLDYRVVAFALNLHPSLKMRGSVSKYLLRQLLYDYLPPALFNRPKWGFGVPMARWLQTDLQFLIGQYLNRQTVLQYGVVHYPSVEQLLKQFEKGQHYLFNRIWQLIVLHQWLEKHG